MKYSIHPIDFKAGVFKNKIQVHAFGWKDSGEIDLWTRLGIASSSGQELAARSRNHAERYPAAQKPWVKVDKVEESVRGFHVKTDEGVKWYSYSGHSERRVAQTSF